MNWQSKPELEVLEQEIKNKLGSAYDVVQSKIRKPRMKIINFNKDFTSLKIVNYVLQENGLTGELIIPYVWKKKSIE